MFSLWPRPVILRGIVPERTISPSDTMAISSNSDVGLLRDILKNMIVYNLDCISCESNLCWRGLIVSKRLEEKRTKLFSSDGPAMGSVDLVPGSETMDKCSCRLQNIACLNCGNVVGYHVKRPCRKCLVKCKNKHLWMFYSDTVLARERIDFQDDGFLLWSNVKSIEEDSSVYFEECLR